MTERTLADRARGGLLGLVVGDALGVPVQFQRRTEVRVDPVTGMDRCFRDLPPGTWSDDSSLALQTAASLAEIGYDPRDLAARFQRWLLDGEMTPHGRSWDIGRTTRRAIQRSLEADAPLASGGDDEGSNGNGSLMRILPLALWIAPLADDGIVEKAFEASALTHAHVRARLCCAIHCLVVKRLLAGRGPRAALAEAAEAIEGRVPAAERPHLAAILTGEILDREDDAIESSGYVVHTLGAALWCISRHDDYRETVLEAVNLGHDADTTGAVAGGLAGVMYGADAIPGEWVEALEARAMVLDAVERFAGALERLRVEEG